MSINKRTLTSLIFTVSFFTNIMTMNPKDRYAPGYFKVYTNDDLRKMFPSRNGLYGYPQPNISEYKPRSIDPNLYAKAMSNILSINTHIMQPNIKDDLPQDLDKAAPQDILIQHKKEVNEVTKANIEMLNHLNQLP